jgi:hypothetical protein
VAGGGMAIVAADNTQCRFNINAYRMVFVVNKENLLYKRQALHRARQVCCIDAQITTYFKFRASLSTLCHPCLLVVQQCEWICFYGNSVAVYLQRIDALKPLDNAA